LKNCAKPMEADLVALGQSVERRAEAVRKGAKKLRQGKKAKAGAASRPSMTTQADGQPEGPTPPAPAQLPLPPGARTEAQPGRAPTQPGPTAAPAARPCEPTPTPLSSAESTGPAASVGATPSPSAPWAGAALTEAQAVEQFCDRVRLNARCRGRPPLDPAPLKRHPRLEDIRAAVQTAREKNQDPDASPG